MSRKVIALVDCASFYASVERTFHASLRGRPLIVLSNNDGNVVAANAEAKKLGFQRGTPYFQCLAAVKQHNVAVFSSNYSLYQVMWNKPTHPY